MPSPYPVPSCAVPVSGGMVVAVPLELLASPLKNGRPLGGGDRSALVIGGTGKVRTGGTVVFCKVVAVAEAQVKRDGQVRAKGSPVHHATLDTRAYPIFAITRTRPDGRAARTAGRPGAARASIRARGRAGLLPWP